MYSNDMRRLQTTSKGGYPLEEEMESQGTVEAHSVSTASGDGRNDVRRYTSNMLEQILGRENMTKAYKRVVANKGSHGIDGMGVDELLPYLKENWATIKQQILAKRIGDKRALKLIRMYLGIRDDDKRSKGKYRRRNSPRWAAKPAVGEYHVG